MGEVAKEMKSTYLSFAYRYHKLVVRASSLKPERQGARHRCYPPRQKTSGVSSLVRCILIRMCGKFGEDVGQMGGVRGPGEQEGG